MRAKIDDLADISKRTRILRAGICRLNDDESTALLVDTTKLTKAQEDSLWSHIGRLIDVVRSE